MSWKLHKLNTGAMEGVLCSCWTWIMQLPRADNICCKMLANPVGYVSCHLSPVRDDRRSCTTLDWTLNHWGFYYVAAWIFIAKYSGSGVSRSGLWWARVEISDLRHFILLKIRSWDIDSAAALAAAAVWHLVPGPSSIMLIRASENGGTEASWHNGLNEPLDRNFLSNISRQTTYAALTRCIASLSKLSCSHAFLMASPISLSNVRSTLYPSLHSLRSEKTVSNLVFSLVLCIQPSTAALNCSRRALYILARSASLNTGFTLSSRQSFSM